MEFIAKCCLCMNFSENNNNSMEFIKPVLERKNNFFCVFSFLVYT